MPLAKDHIKSRPYTKEDLDYVRKHYHDTSFDELKKQLNRNGAQVGYLLNLVIRENIEKEEREAMYKPIGTKTKRPPAVYSNIDWRRKYGL